MGVYRVEIPGHTHRLNQLMHCHWGIMARRKKADRELVGLLCREAGVPEAASKRLVRLTVVLGPRQRGGDGDAYWKSLLDALVACKAIRGDGKEWVILEPVRYTRGIKASMVVELEDV